MQIISQNIISDAKSNKILLSGLDLLEGVKASTPFCIYFSFASWWIENLIKTIQQ
jgi:hypothetical protein